MKERYCFNSNDCNSILEYFGCFETFWNFFNIEHSCGDGLFLSDIEHDIELLNKYDGCVDENLFRHNETKKIYKIPRILKFTYDDNEIGMDAYSKPTIGKMLKIIKTN